MPTRLYPVSSVSKVIDGDTMDLVVDLGFHVQATLRFRLKAVNCAELGTPGGAAARSFADEWLRASERLDVLSWKSPGAYGRWEGIIIRPDGTTLNDALVAAGKAAVV